MSARTEVRVLSASVTEERALWLSLWNRWEGREVFAHPAYVQIFARGTGERAVAATMDLPDGTGGVIYPLVVRPLIEEWVPGELREACDLTGPYGYGGPFAWGSALRSDMTEQFWNGFDEWGERSRVVSEFTRLSLFDESLLEFRGETEARQENVVRDLTLPADALWMDYEHKVRKNVKKAQRLGVEIVLDDTGARIEDFLAIYERTMDRREAGSYYRFEPAFFQTVHRELAGSFMYFHALAEGKVVSTELVLVSADNVYSFLGGTDEAAFDLRPNDLLKHAIIGWAKEAGKKHFVLGGGFQPMDGIFRYKLSFAPSGARTFRIGKRIRNAAAYGALTRARGVTESGFFPSYRA